MSYLKQLVDADKYMRAHGAGPCMSINVAYSKAVEVAELADRALSKGWKAERVDSHWPGELTAWRITSPTGDFVTIDDSYHGAKEELLRQLAHDLAWRPHE